MSSKLAAVLKICRPVNFILTFLSIFVAGLIGSQTVFQWVNIIFASFSGALIASGGNVINDYFDIEIDKINRPERVLPQKLLSIKSALIIYIILNLVALSLAFSLNTVSFLIALSAGLIIFFYSYMLKKVLLVGNFTVSFFTGLAFIYCAVAVDNIHAGIVPAVFALLINFIRELVKDVEDQHGDSTNKVITFPYLYGYTKTFYLIAGLTLLLIITTTIPFFYKLYRIEYFIIVMCVVNIILIYILKKLYKDTSQKNLRKMSSLLKLDMLLGLIAIFIGAFLYERF